MNIGNYLICTKDDTGMIAYEYFILYIDSVLLNR